MVKKKSVQEAHKHTPGKTRGLPILVLGLEQRLAKCLLGLAVLQLLKAKCKWKQEVIQLLTGESERVVGHRLAGQRRCGEAIVRIDWGGQGGWWRGR